MFELRSMKKTMKIAKNAWWEGQSKYTFTDLTNQIISQGEHLAKIVKKYNHSKYSQLKSELIDSDLVDSPETWDDTINAEKEYYKFWDEYAPKVTPNDVKSYVKMFNEQHKNPKMTFADHGTYGYLNVHYAQPVSKISNVYDSIMGASAANLPRNARKAKNFEYSINYYTSTISDNGNITSLIHSLKSHMPKAVHDNWSDYEYMKHILNYYEVAHEDKDDRLEGPGYDKLYGSKNYKTWNLQATHHNIILAMYHNAWNRNKISWMAVMQDLRNNALLVANQHISKLIGSYNMKKYEERKQRQNSQKKQNKQKKIA